MVRTILTVKLIALVLCTSLYSSSAVNLGSSLMRQMWMTPIQLYSLATSEVSGLPMPVLNGSVLSSIKAEVIAHFHHHQRSGPLIDKDATTSDSFYMFQREEDLQYKRCLLQDNKNFPCSTSRPAVYSHLASIFRTAMIQYLQECHQNAAAEALRIRPDYEQNMHIWSSVHANGSFHSAHHHQDASISGILYITTPPGSGAVVFNDPRGQLPPFGKSLQIVPKVGELIMFPSWLVHSVLPTMSTQSRISVSFNYLGSWEATSDVNQAYYTEP